MKIKIQNSKIIANKKVRDRYFKIVVAAPAIASGAMPGQFVEVKVSNSLEPLLRRPFSIHRISGSNIEILYEVVGPGTKILSRRKKREYLSVIGPLGNGFQLPTPNSQLQTILVAGGMGVAPLVFLAEKLKRRNTEYGIRNTVLIGGRTRNHILCEKEFKDSGCSVKIATDDGSRGFKGYVSELLNNLLSTIDYRPSTIYACGPRPMLKELSRISQKYNIRAQISLEEHLACGIGACLGCVVKTKEGYKRVCQEGPVFAAKEIIW